MNYSNILCRKANASPFSTVTTLDRIHGQSLWGTQEKIAIMGQNRSGELLQSTAHEDMEKIQWRANAES